MMHDIFSYLEMDERYTGRRPHRDTCRSIYTDLFEDFFGPDYHEDYISVSVVNFEDADEDEPLEAA